MTLFVFRMTQNMARRHLISHLLAPTCLWSEMASQLLQSKIRSHIRDVCHKILYSEMMIMIQSTSSPATWNWFYGWFCIALKRSTRFGAHERIPWQLPTQCPFLSMYNSFLAFLTPILSFLSPSVFPFLFSLNLAAMPVSSWGACRSRAQHAAATCFGSSPRMIAHQCATPSTSMARKVGQQCGMAMFFHFSLFLFDF